MVGIGITASSFDLLQQATVQRSVADAARGRAMDYWVASLGFGPLGHLELGGLAVLLGPPLALGLNGAVVLVVFMGVATWSWRGAGWRSPLSRRPPKLPGEGSSPASGQRR